MPLRTLLLTGALAAFSMAAVAQPVNPPNSPPDVNQPAISSNGPVVLDYNKTIPNTGHPTEMRIAKQVRHQLLMMPANYYSMFDDIEYSVQGRTVTLSGYVTAVHSVTKTSAANAVKHIEGVDAVVNEIQVLPPNLLDEQARERVLHTLLRTGPLAQYFWPASPAIHIIVKNQRLTLTGYVNNEGDKNLATVASNQVRDLFQVTNNLQVVR